MSVGARWACEKLLTVCSVQAAPQPSELSPGGQEGPGSSGFLVFQWKSRRFHEAQLQPAA